MLVYYLFNYQEEESLTSFNFSIFAMILCIPIHMVDFKTKLDLYYKIHYNIFVDLIRYVAILLRFPSPRTILDVGLDQGSSHPFNNCES